MAKFTSEQQAILKTSIKLMKAPGGGLPKLLDLINAGVSRAKLRHHIGSIGVLYEMLKTHFPKEYDACFARGQISAARARLIDTTKNLITALGRFPTAAELEASGITRAALREHFPGVNQLFEFIKKEHADLFLDLFSSSEFTEERMAETLDRIATTDQFAISTIVSGCSLHEGAYDALETWRASVGGQTIFQPLADPARPRQGQAMFFDTRLKHDNIAFRDIHLNDKVHLLSILYSAKRINPHDAAKRFVDNQSLSFIASPKQKLTPLANMQGQPGYAFSTGAITVADYTTEMYMSNGTAYVAEITHNMGAGIVQIIGKNRYKFNNVEFDLDGSFALDGSLYMPDGSCGEIDTDYLFLGDLHCAEIDRAALDEVCVAVAESKPAEIFVQDAFSGVSINPFDTRSPMKQFHNKQVSKSLSDEILDMHNIFSRLNAICDSTIQVVHSNHHLFLQMYIDSGRYAKEVTNFEIGHKLAWIRMQDPEADLLEAAYKLVVPESEQLKALVFNGPRVSIKRHGVECGVHGHKGAQGKKSPNIQTLRAELGHCNAGHGHCSEIHDGAFRVGTMEHIWDKAPAYARDGADLWSQSFVRGYSNGKRQLVHIVKKGA
jgi:hypothetical protein